ncbi:MAG: AMP-binding protein [Luteolibacter sp.]
MDAWDEVVARKGDEVAFWSPRHPQGVTFEEIERMAGKVDVRGEYVRAVGSSMDFFPTLIAAWRAGKPALLLENICSRVRPIVSEIPAGTVLIKQTCGACGIERSLFFDDAAVFSEGMRNVAGLGLHEGRRGMAAISLAHSYGFGCLALPLVLAGIPLDIVDGPLPMLMNSALERGGEIFLPGVPAIWKTWWQTGVAKSSGISLGLCAGSPLSLELEGRILEECGLKVRNFYGTSETGAISYDDSEVVRTEARFVGKLLPGVEAGRDGSGRVVVTSDSMAMGADTEAWEGEFSGESYRTLDEGDVREEGVFLDQCVGGAINVAGRKVSPARVQGMLEGLAGVRAALVERGLSRDFERFEEIRVVVKVAKGCEKKVLREELRQKLESWEMPRQWVVEIV